MKNNRAQALVEYILIIALVSILIISLIKYFGGYIRDAITKTSCNISGQEYVAGAKAGEGYCDTKDTDELFEEKEEENNKDTKER